MTITHDPRNEGQSPEFTPQTQLAGEVFFRSYVDGKLGKSTKTSRDRAVKWLNNSQVDWSRNLSPLVQPGEFDPNNGHEVNRVSETELLVTTTGNRKLRFVIVEKKGE